MIVKFKTSGDYKKAVYEIAKDQVEFAKILNHFNPDGKYKSIHRSVQKKVNGEASLTNSDIIIINMLYQLKELNALPKIKGIEK